jgi:hypothetical protein
MCAIREIVDLQMSVHSALHGLSREPHHSRLAAITSRFKNRGDEQDPRDRSVKLASLDSVSTIEGRHFSRIVGSKFLDAV